MLLLVFRAKREQKFGSCIRGVGRRMESQDLSGGISIYQPVVGKCGLKEGDASHGCPQTGSGESKQQHTLATDCTLMLLRRC